MSHVTNVFRRGGRYYYRTRVPQRLKASVGRLELWKSLRTSDPQEARQRASYAVLLTSDLWDVLEQLMSSSRTPPSPVQIKVMIDQWLKAELDRDAVLRRGAEADREGAWHAGVVLERTPEGVPERVVEYLDQAAVDALEKGEREPLTAPQYLVACVTDAQLERGQRHKVFGDSRRRFNEGDASIASRHVMEIFERNSLHVDLESEEFDMATRLMVRAHRDLVKAVEHRESARWRPYYDDDPAEDLVEILGTRASSLPVATVAPTTQSVEDHAGDTTVSELLAAWTAEARKLGDITEGRIKEYEVAAGVFIGWLESDPALANVSSSIAGRFRQELPSYPVNATKSPAFRLLSVRERIEKARSDSNVATLAVATINGKYLDPLRGLFDWAKSTGRVASNPFTGVTVTRGKSSANRVARGDFSADQLRTLFSAPVFTGAEGDAGAPLYRAGAIRITDWRYWLPLIALFSGARLNELAGLRVSDFGEEQRVSFFHVRPTEERRLKTAASKRIVPIHDVLIDLGFLEVIEQVRASGGDRIFPDLKPGPRGHLSHTPSKFFGRLIDRVLGNDASVVFHSFRHTFITAMRAAGVAKELRTAIVGHEDGDTHDGYGSEPISRLNEAVQAVTFPSLDLARLRLPSS